MKIDPSSTTSLVAFAVMAVLILLLISDLSPTTVNRFDDLPEDGKPFEAICMVVSEREAKGGRILELRDSDGLTMKAYCPTDACKDLQLPCAAYVTGRLDDGPEPFMFIDTIEPCGG